MPSFLRRRPSAAMLVALAALVWATCGQAIADAGHAVVAALKPNSVTGKTVKNGTLTLADFRKSERAKLRGAAGPQGPAGPAGPSGTPNGYTTAQADAAFLGKGAKAADADSLDGLDSTSLVHGNGFQSDVQRVVTDDTVAADLLTIPGFGALSLNCGLGGLPGFTLRNTTGVTVPLIRTYLAAGATAEVISQAVSVGGSAVRSGPAAGFQETLMLHRGTLLTGTYRATVIISGVKAGADCSLHAQAFGSSTLGTL